MTFAKRFATIGHKGIKELVLISSERLHIGKFKVGYWKDLYEYPSDERVAKYEPYTVFEVS